MDFFDFFDQLGMMPIAAIATCLLVSRVIGVEQIAQEVEQDGQRFRRKPVFNFMIAGCAPFLQPSFWQARWQMPLLDRHVNSKQYFRQQNASF